MKIYFIQSMKNKTKTEIVEERRAAEECITLALQAAIKPATKLVTDMEHGEVWGLGKEMQQMDDASEVVLLPGWTEDNGCLLKKAAADYFGYRQIELAWENGQLTAPMGQMSL